MGREYVRNTAFSFSETKTGNAPDAYAGITTFTVKTDSILMMAFDNPAIFRTGDPAAGWNEDIELPANSGLSIDGAFRGFDVHNKTAGLVARYQVVGTWRTP